jgi:hypothetical protein
LAPKKRFLLRLDPELHRRLESWAADELRSVNGQIEFLLREAMVRAGRARTADESAGPDRVDDTGE